ncbi:MAG: MATE family efflux transporter [Cellulosilyticum sp.]|nr:MATE family efflux transporter [Cellulosilyticum sp.]
MGKQIDLTTGPITGKLIKLAMPIMGVSFVQTAYSLIDMIWIGKAGSAALAAVGTAGFFTWLAEAFYMLPRLGASIRVAQSVGQKDYKKTKHYITSALQMTVALAFFYGLILLLFNQPFVEFFALGDESINQMARTYLVTVGAGMLFCFSGPVFTGIFTGLGDSKTPFIINTIGLVINIILDPILIFGFGHFEGLGVLGAALATVTAQVIVTLLFIMIVLKRKLEYFSINIFKNPRWDLIKDMTILGLPGAIQSAIYTMISMVIGRIVANWGPVAIAAQKVGSQIEAISWMTAGGFSTAISTYVGQNYGAHQYERIKKGVKVTILIAMGVGVFAMLLLVLVPGFLMRIFVSEVDTIEVGRQYLSILGFSQMFMCMEITMVGAFSGLGRTYLPNAIVIILTALRIPMAIFLSQSLSLNGVWWSISLSSVGKGLLLMGIYLVLSRKSSFFNKYTEQ